MAKGTLISKWGAASLLAAALAWGGTDASAPLKPEAKDAKPGNAQVTPAPAKGDSPLSEAFIAQSLLRVYLDRPASVTVYNARGQQIFRRDSFGPVETVPLQGITTGFVYLTVRAGKVEATRKMVYTGK
jgi:hypothetical protein